MKKHNKLNRATQNNKNKINNPNNNQTIRTSDNNFTNKYQSSRTKHTPDNNFPNPHNKTLIKTISYSEISLILLATFAFAFLISQTSFVSAAETGGPPATDTQGSAGSAGAAIGTSAVAAGASQSSGVKVLFEEVAKKKQGLSLLGSRSSNSLVISGSQETLKGIQIGDKLYSGQITKAISLADGGAELTIGGQSVKLTAEQLSSIQSQLTAGGIGIQSQYPYELPFLGIEFSGAAAHLVQGLVWAGVVAGIALLIGQIAGEQKIANAIALSAFGGIMTYKGLLAIGPSGTGTLGPNNFLIQQAPLIGIGVAIAIFILTYKKEKQKIVQFQCLPWEPPIGGSKCEECNKDPFRPCSEYRCKALGQACELLNPGTNEERCAWVAPGDVNSPTITPDASKFKPKDLAYKPDNSIRPPNRGVKIVRGADACLQAFTPLEFGFTTNEPGQCKISYQHTSKFDEMEFFVGETNYFQYNHTQKMRLPAPEAVSTDPNATAPGSPILGNDGTFSLFVRCQDANGNQNVDEYVFNFCVDKSPDTTPPVIEQFSISSGSPVSYNSENVPIIAYINEPAQCKWSRESKAFEEMENSMSCSDQISIINAEQLYPCSSTLTGIKNREDNKFYFRCKDQPDAPDNERNVNTQSKELILKGSQPLDILKVGPNETIRGSTDTVQVKLTVETSNGAEEGKAICYFSPTAQEDSFIQMFKTNSFQHEQSLDLTSGNYEYHFRCIDLGGNSDSASTKFTVFVDKSAPLVTRAYKQEGLKIVTNEDAECAYSLTSCNFNFNEGLKLIYSNPSIKTNHFAPWDIKSTYYIKCQDFQGNQPSPSACSIIVSAIELSSQ